MPRAQPAGSGRDRSSADHGTPTPPDIESEEAAQPKAEYEQRKTEYEAHRQPTEEELKAEYQRQQKELRPKLPSVRRSKGRDGACWNESSPMPDEATPEVAVTGHQ